MLNKNRTLLLLLILAIAAGLYFILYYTGDDEKNFRSKLEDFDTAVVNRIEIIPPFPADRIDMVKQEGNWFINEKNNQYAANDMQIERLMASLDGLSVKNVAATSSDQWENFKVTDKEGARLQFYKNNDKLSEVVIGKFDYIQPKSNQPDQFGRQPQGQMLSYARVPGSDIVYTIDGMIALNIGKSAADYRDKILLSLKAENIAELQFDYSDNESFKLFKEGEKWLSNSVTADSAEVAKYIRGLANKRGKDFSNGPLNEADLYASLTINRVNLESVIVKAYAPDTSAYLLVSSLNPTNIIKDTDKNLTQKLFVSLSYFAEKDK